MTNKETIERNIGLTFDFVNYLADNPEAMENLPDNFTLDFAEKDFPKVEKPVQVVPGQTQTRKVVRVRNAFDMAK